MRTLQLRLLNEAQVLGDIWSYPVDRDWGSLRGHEGVSRSHSIAIVAGVASAGKCGLGGVDLGPVCPRFGALVAGSYLPRCECNSFCHRVIPAETIPKSTVTHNSLSR